MVFSKVGPIQSIEWGQIRVSKSGVFGNLADLDRLVAEAHRRGLRLIPDFVPNYTSNEHPRFIESRSLRANPKRDWHIWRDAGGGGRSRG